MVHFGVLYISDDGGVPKRCGGLGWLTSLTPPSWRAWTDGRTTTHANSSTFTKIRSAKNPSDLSVWVCESSQ